jgi:integrase/recombinase XerC/integrase/recombinase XerD
LTKEEFERLLECSSEFYKTVWIVLVYTGIRLDEARLLKWIDIDFENRVIKIGFREDFTTKTGIKKVEKVLNNLPHIGEYIFCNPQTGEPYHKNSWLKQIKKYAEKAGIENVLIHTLRHTFSSWLAQKGISRDIRMTLLGHTDEKTTDIYTHFPIEQIRKAIEEL